MHWSRTLAVCLALWSLTPAAALADTRVALVIGNGAYAHAPHLPNPTHDAADVAAALKRTGFDTILGTDLDKAGMDAIAIRFARAARTADVAVFYYSGHAMQYADVNYLFPIDATLSDEADLRRMSRVDEILADLQQAKNLRILVLDSCRDNPLADELKRSIGPSRSAGIGRGLARMASPDGAIISYSTQAGRTAADGDGRNSPYTTAFLRHIEDKDEIATVFHRISADVFETSKGKQVPELSLSFFGEFYLNGKLQITVNPPPTPAPTDPCASAESHWKSAEAIGTAAAFEDHLARFANCIYAALAKARLAALTSPAEPVVRIPPAIVVDSAAVGTWEAKVPNNRGVARWVWDILPGGTYRFHSEGPGAVGPHEGTVNVTDGHWTLRATHGLPDWVDGGSYEFRDPNTLEMTGWLGTGIWRRVDGGKVPR
ncbi:MAG TPA: caspase family protein [Xanthobacteraceae bacterium]